MAYKSRDKSFYNNKRSSLLARSQRLIFMCIILIITPILILIYANQNSQREVNNEMVVSPITFNEAVKLGSDINLQSEKVVKMDLYNLCGDILGNIDRNNLLQFYHIKQRLSYEKNRDNSFILNAIVITSLNIITSRIIGSEKIESIFILGIDNESSNGAEYILSDTNYIVSYDKESATVETVGYYSKSRSLMVTKGFEIVGSSKEETPFVYNEMIFKTRKGQGEKVVILS